jgi:hypothetical protein
MNAKIRMSMVLVAFVLTFRFLIPDGSALAQPANSNCKQAKGQWIDVYPGTGNATFGRISSAGVLDGTSETIFNSAPFPTPVATIVSYTGNSTFTTLNGQLKTNNVYLYDFATGLFTILAHINPNTSTGRFAGATGALFAGGKTIGNGFTYAAEINGEVCFANE